MPALASSDVAETGRALSEFVATRKDTTLPDSTWTVPIAERLRELVGDMAPSSMRSDLRSLVEQAKKDLAVPPAAALQQVNKLRASLLSRVNCRFTLTGSPAHTAELARQLEAVFSQLSSEESPERPPPTVSIVNQRLRDHQEVVARPVHFGVVQSGATTGVFVLTVEAAGLSDLREEALLDGLGSTLFRRCRGARVFHEDMGSGTRLFERNQR